MTVETVRVTFMNDRESDGKLGELLNELFSAFEDLETQSAGILQFLKEKGLATDEELAPYLKQAGDASEVRWRAARLRMDALLAAAIRDAKEEFARKAEERARAHEESKVQKQDDQGESEQKGANEARTSSRNVDSRNADARKEKEKEEVTPKAQAENAESKAEAKPEVEQGAGQDKMQAAKAANEEVKTNAEAAVAKKETPVENGGNGSTESKDGTESKTGQKAA
jgi:hypothetical protein